jgi:uncharacterized membrane protein
MSWVSSLSIFCELSCQLNANARRVTLNYLCGIACVSLAICMFSVLQSHSLWPRTTFWGNLGCSWVSQHGILTNLHTGFELLCMPGFATLAGMNDLVLLKRQPIRGTKLLMSAALRSLCAYFAAYLLSDMVAAAYLEGWFFKMYYLK